MRTLTKDVESRISEVSGRIGSPIMPPALLAWLTPHELESLGSVLKRDSWPADFAAKIRQLALGDIRQRFIAQSCQRFAALYQAGEAGLFRKSDAQQRERILRVLAYVRKDDDAIPDYQSDGYLDDMQQVHSAVMELGDLLATFKAWRLQNQVPTLWLKESCACGLGLRFRS